MESGKLPNQKASAVVGLLVVTQSDSSGKSSPNPTDSSKSQNYLVTNWELPYMENGKSPNIKYRCTRITKIQELRGNWKKWKIATTIIPFLWLLTRAALSYYSVAILTLMPCSCPGKSSILTPKFAFFSRNHTLCSCLGKSSILTPKLFSRNHTLSRDLHSCCIDWAAVPKLATLRGGAVKN